jgi:serine protease Do
VLRNRWLKISLILVSILLIAITPCLALKRVVPETTKEAIVDKYLKGRALDAVEGVWSFTVKGYYGEVAIIKNTTKEYPGWGYLGVIVSGNVGGQTGEVKIALNKTAAEDVYTGFYVVVTQALFFSSGSEEKTNFVQHGKNVMWANVPDLGIINFVRIDTLKAGDGGGGGSGTGFFITPSVVITNHHVVKGAKRLEVTFQNEITLPAKVLAKDPNNDVAVLQVEGLEGRVKPFPLGRASSAKEGERVYTVGFPLSTNLSERHKITEGLINGLTGIRDDPTAFQISIPIQPGNSGGPLITADGRVIGITSSGLKSAYFLEKMGDVPQNVNFAVKSDYIMPLLDVAGVKIERQERQEKLLDPVTIMEMAKDAVVYVRNHRE